MGNLEGKVRRETISIAAHSLRQRSGRDPIKNGRVDIEQDAQAANEPDPTFDM